LLYTTVAAGLRCTLANNAYNARELRHQYIDSGAWAIFTSEDGVATSREMLGDLGLNAYEADRRIFVMSNCLAWAGGPSIPIKSDLSGFLQVSDLLKLGALKEEDRFDGDLAQETVYLCYSSGSWFLQLTSRNRWNYSAGTTGKPKGVEVLCPKYTSTAPDLPIGCWVSRLTEILQV